MDGESARLDGNRIMPRRALNAHCWIILLLVTVLVPGTRALAGEHGEGRSPDEQRIIDMVEQYGPSVVAVHVTLGDMQLDPMMGPEEQVGGGSGFIVDRKGRIATNYHVVAAALADMSVDTLPDASITVSFLSATDREFTVRVLGAMPDYDLALLAFEDPADVPAVAPLPLGDSDSVRPGQEVIVIGTPFGLHSTVTAGIVSAVEREQPGIAGIEIPFIQTDAAINPGNSGGPMLDSNAEVIGISNAILASPAAPGGVPGVGFAVPVNLLKAHMGELLAGGLSGVAAAVAELRHRPRLGVNAPVTVDDYPHAVRERFDLPEHGVVIMDVVPGGPADRAGLSGPSDTVMFSGHALPAGGDIITGIDGQDVRRIIDLQQVLLERKAGDQVDLRVWRDGRERHVKVRIAVVEEENADGG